MTNTVQLNDAQIKILQNLNDTHRYPEAYRYLRDIAIQASMASTTPEQHQQLEILSTWLDRAASINANDGSFSIEFVRGATAEFGALGNMPISDEKFQDASNKLADIHRAICSCKQSFYF